MPINMDKTIIGNEILPDKRILKFGATNPETGQRYEEVSYPTITADSLKTEKPIEVPTPPQDTTNYQGLINGGNAYSTLTTPQTQTPTDMTDMLTRLKEMYVPSTDQSASYEQIYGQYATPKEQELTAKQTAQTSAQKELDLLNAQMQDLIAQSQAVPIQVQQEAEGRGMTKAGTAVITAGRQREIALKSLPLQGQILGAQARVAAAQGDVQTAQTALKMAQDKINMVFDIKSKYETNLYNYNKDLRDKVWDYATAKEKDQLDALQKEDDRKYDEYKANITALRNLSVTATENGQIDLAAKISQLDPNSKTFNQDYLTLQGQIKINQDKELVANLIGDYPDAGIIPTDDITTAQSKLSKSRIYQEQVRAPQGKTTEPEKPLSILDIQRYQEAYPDAGIGAGDTESTANAKALKGTQPKDFTDEEIRQLVNDDKSQNKTYEEVIAAIDAFPTLANKDRAKFIVAEIYGKAGGKTFEEWMGKSKPITSNLPVYNAPYVTSPAFTGDISAVQANLQSMQTDELYKYLFK